MVYLLPGAKVDEQLGGYIVTRESLMIGNFWIESLRGCYCGWPENGKYAK